MHQGMNHPSPEDRIAELEAELRVADKGLLKASDPNSGWQGISKECKLWQEKAETLEQRNRALVEALEKISLRSIPMTATGEYRRAYLDALEVVGGVAKQAIKETE